MLWLWILISLLLLAVGGVTTWLLLRKKKHSDEYVDPAKLPPKRPLVIKNKGNIVPNGAFEIFFNPKNSSKTEGQIEIKTLANESIICTGGTYKWNYTDKHIEISLNDCGKNYLGKNGTPTWAYVSGSNLFDKHVTFMNEKNPVLSTVVRNISMGACGVQLCDKSIKSNDKCTAAGYSWVDKVSFPDKIMTGCCKNMCVNMYDTYQCEKYWKSQSLPDNRLKSLYKTSGRMC